MWLALHVLAQPLATSPHGGALSKPHPALPSVHFVQIPSVGARDSPPSRVPLRLVAVVLMACNSHSSNWPPPLSSAQQGPSVLAWAGQAARAPGTPPCRVPLPPSSLPHYSSHPPPLLPPLPNCDALLLLLLLLSSWGHSSQACCCLLQARCPPTPTALAAAGQPAHTHPPTLPHLLPTCTTAQWPPPRTLHCAVCCQHGEAPTEALQQPG